MYETAFDSNQNSPYLKPRRLVPPPAVPLRVPPPPNTPVFPLLAQGLVGPGYTPEQGQPQPSMKTALPSAPQAAPVNVSVGNSQTGLVPMEEIQRLRDRSTSMQDIAQKMLESANYEAPASLETPKQSPFEASMEQAAAAKVMDLMRNKGSAMDRFNSGRNLGQKLAADIIVPLMGTFSKHAGSAMGAANATQQLQQQINQNDAQERQDRAARNQTLASMSQMWETLSPSSSKNLMQMMQLRLAGAKERQTTHHQNLQDALSAARESTSAQNDVINALGKGDQREIDRAYKSGKTNNDTKKIDETIRENGEKDYRGNRSLDVQQQNADTGTGNLTENQKRTGIMQENANTSKAAQEETVRRNKDEHNFKATEQSVKDSLAQLKVLSQFNRNLGETNATGQSKYGADFLDRTESNPAMMEGLDKALGRSGAAQEMIAGIRKQRASSSAPARNPLDSFLTPLQQGLQTLQGRQHQPSPPNRQAQRDALPTKPGAQKQPELKAQKAHMDHSLSGAQMMDDFKKKNGRDPNADEFAKLMGAK